MDLNFAKIRTISIHLDIIDLFNILDLNEPITDPSIREISLCPEAQKAGLSEIIHLR